MFVNKKSLFGFKLVPLFFQSKGFQFSESFFHETIFALSSGYGKSAISIIRVSGKDAFKSLNYLHNSQIDLKSVFPNHQSFFDPSIRKMEPFRAYHKKFYSFFDYDNNSNRKILDEGIVLLFPEPKSFTGEKFHIHGSKAIQSKMLNELGKIESFRLAEPGEFTKRAFFNGKLDLMKVEGLSDLLNAETEEQRVQSMHHYQGDASAILEKWRTELIQCLAHAEAFIDFEEHEEDVQSDVYDKVAVKVKGIIEELKKHLNNKNRGEILRDGYRISIVGPPNAGKSSLLNILARRKVAIVSDIPGTTRDVLTTSLNLGGFPVILSDTAGLRETKDTIESEGVKLALEHSKAANLNIILLDVDDLIFGQTSKTIKTKKTLNFENFTGEMDAKKTIVVINKADKKFKSEEEALDGYKLLFENQQFHVFGMISCLNEYAINDLIELLSNRIQTELLSNEQSNSEFSIVTKARHRLELEKCLAHLENFYQRKNSIELSCEELRSAVGCIGKLTGRIDVEEILDVLFRDFCIGK